VIARNGEQRPYRRCVEYDMPLPPCSPRPRPPPRRIRPVLVSLRSTNMIKTRTATTRARQHEKLGRRGSQRQMRHNQRDRKRSRTTPKGRGRRRRGGAGCRRGEEEYRGRRTRRKHGRYGASSTLLRRTTSV
jgi:hypothetical protein